MAYHLFVVDRLDRELDVAGLCVALLVAFVNGALAQGGTVLIPEGDPLVADPAFVHDVLGGIRPHATLAYGQPVAEAGLHLVQIDTDHWVENVTGLAACGVHAVVGSVANGSPLGRSSMPTSRKALQKKRE